ncbi:glycosyltransferase family 90 protein [Amanita thiersii Skay4041]|uniref:Glycosyltransferase family 90 protein n=1 Tax=Amanita thiersii Skay4041 TaxID=703135 RepID=A0A2A9NTI7_9AGAR|nr:glycosyltransferase family 90 protein [Amanita thiersii Skay4041]
MDQALEGHDDTHQHQQVPNQIGSLRSLETHTYREDGLVEVNPNGPHPIFKLIRDAEKAWERKHRRASRTLREAVREYKRRYMRDPPRGFDHWWSYVQKHNVQLPDEYDQIYHDLEPYWGMDPRDLQTMQSDWEAHADSYTLGKDKTEESIKLVNFTLPGNENVRYNLAGGGLELIELLEDVEKYIPPFRAVFSPHDNPNLPTDYELKKMALEAAKSETYIDLNNPPEVKLDGWISACPPSSPARLHPLDLENSSPLPPRTTKTFIHDHRLSMDPCLHPTHLLHHGQFLSHNKGPVPHRFMVPQFSYCPTMLHHDIMAAMPINWVQDILPRSTDPEWDAREDERLHWRGRNTGIWHAKHTRWHAAHRDRLVDWANRGLEGNLSLLLPRRDEKIRVGESVKVKKARYAPAMLDVAFVGGPISCEEGTCQEMEEYYEFRKAHDKRMEGRYKYVVDVDGNGWSSRFKRLITSNSLVFKSTVYPEWYTDRIEPWVHYVPIQVDYSDLFDALIFFRGGLDAPEDDANPNSNGAHEDLARKIARAGREWSLKYWRREDLTAYMFRLFLEYARVMSVNRKDEVFVLT